MKARPELERTVFARWHDHGKAIVRILEETKKLMEPERKRRIGFLRG